MTYSLPLSAWKPKDLKGELLEHLLDDGQQVRLADAIAAEFSVNSLTLVPGANPAFGLTMSTSKKPGGGSRQSENVRTGMLRRMAVPTPVRRLRCPSNARTRITQGAVDCRGTDLQELGLDHGIQLKVAVSLHRDDQDWDQNFQPLAADTVARLPQHDESLAHCFVV